MAELYDVMSTLRAVRKLRPDPIPDDVLDRVLQAACWAPTGGNTQPWRVVVATGTTTKEALQEIYEPEWDRYSAGFMKMMSGLPADELAKWERVVAAGDHLAQNLGRAPAILMFCANPEMMAITDADLDRISMVGGGSVYPAVQNAMLACVQEGLGCTLTTLHCLQEDRVKEVLAIPADWATVAMVPIGYPVGRGHGPITRRPPSKMAFRDHFGTAWT
jgi:nitroreductase